MTTPTEPSDTGFVPEAEPTAPHDGGPTAGCDDLPARYCAPKRVLPSSRIGDIPDAGHAGGGAPRIRAAGAGRHGVCSEPTPWYRGGEWARPLRVDDPGELIAAMPAMVGFPPERSLVIAVLADGVAAGASPMIEAVVRFDLDPSGKRRGAATMFATCIAQICTAEEAREVLAVIVDDRMREPAPHESRTRRAGGEPSLGALVTALHRRLARRGIELGGAWAVRAIEAEQRWWSLFDPEHRGTVPDPTASSVALAHVLDGRPIRRSRSELTALVAADPAICAEVAAQLDSALAAARDRFTRAVRHGDLDGYRRGALEHVLWQIANAESGSCLDAWEIAELVAALRDRDVRDTMFALAVGDHAAAAERLWVAMVRALSGPDRADIAALLGYSAYVRGDGPFAGIALDAALTADPANPMAILLETSLRAGMRPESLRRLARSGYATASYLGIDLGPVVR
ncbi:DUF4192 domain-containing protein [Nocardia sp. NPDC050710]|uniref:DUF4192 domain-containing protein n=1 Tax=Nocardia sp. NPDC050710 TaxID=3157220 RepID=UPI00340B4C23